MSSKPYLSAGEISYANLSVDAANKMCAAHGCFRAITVPVLINGNNVLSITKPANWVFEVEISTPNENSTYTLLVSGTGRNLSEPNVWGVAIQGSAGAGVSGMTTTKFQLIFGQSSTTTAEYMSFVVFEEKTA